MESFEQLANQYQPMIHKMIKTLNIYKNVNEFYQTGLIALWDAQKSFNGDKGTFSNYAYSTIRGRMMQELSKNRLHSERFVCPEDEYWELVEDPHDSQSLEEDFLQTYGQNLTEKETKWLVMACFNGLSIKEIAEIENVTISAVKLWRTNARKKLREQLSLFEK
jgi:RNA polymerase sigma factor (sigma-70 family)